MFITRQAFRTHNCFTFARFANRHNIDVETVRRIHGAGEVNKSSLEMNLGRHDDLTRRYHLPMRARRLKIRSLTFGRSSPPPGRSIALWNNLRDWRRSERRWIRSILVSSSWACIFSAGSVEWIVGEERIWLAQSN